MARVLVKWSDFEETSVVAGHEQRPGKTRERLLQLFDGRQIQVVGWFIENQEVHPERLEDRQLHSRSLAGREGAGRAGDFV